MNPTFKRILIALLGIVVAGASTRYPQQYALAIAVLGGMGIGTGGATVHDAGHVTVFGIDIGKPSA